MHKSLRRPNPWYCQRRRSYILHIANESRAVSKEEQSHSKLTKYAEGKKRTYKERTDVLFVVKQNKNIIARVGTEIKGQLLASHGNSQHFQKVRSLQVSPNLTSWVQHKFVLRDSPHRQRTLGFIREETFLCCFGLHVQRQSHSRSQWNRK